METAGKNIQFKFIGHRAVCVSNTSYYASNYCDSMPEEALKVKLRILGFAETAEEIESELEAHR